MMADFSAVLTPLVGSSSKMTSGRSANAEATSRSFLSPWGSWRAGTWRLSASPKSSATSSAPSCTSRSPASERKSDVPRPSREMTGASRVSSTVRSGKICTSWKLRARPSPVRATGPMPATSRSLKRTVPAVGRSTPVSRLMRVDLPAPLGPMIETNSPAPTARLTPSSATKLP